MSHKAENTAAAHEPVNEEQERKSQENKSEENKSHAGSEDAAAELEKIDKYARSGPHPTTGLIIYSALQFVTLLLIVIATPIGMFELNRTWRVKLYGPTTSTKSLCVTAWGMKDGCNTARYYNRDFTHTFCYRVRVNFKLVEAFCIMTIGFMSLGLIMGILAVFHKVSKGATGAVGTFAMVLCIIPWGIVAGMYHQKPCCETNGWNTDNKVTICTGNNTRLGAEDVPPFKTMGKFGAGFGLIVASWAIQVIALVFAFVPF